MIYTRAVKGPGLGLSKAYVQNMQDGPKPVEGLALPRPYEPGKAQGLKRRNSVFFNASTLLLGTVCKPDLNTPLSELGTINAM